MTDGIGISREETGNEVGEGEADNDTIMITVPASTPSPSRKSPSPAKSQCKSPPAKITTTAAVSRAKTTRKEPVLQSQSQSASKSPPKAGDISPPHNSPSPDHNDADAEEAEVEAEFVSARKQYDDLSAQKYELLLQIARLEGKGELEMLWNEVERREYVVSAMRNKVRGLERGLRDR